LPSEVDAFELLVSDAIQEQLVFDHLNLDTMRHMMTISTLYKSSNVMHCYDDDDDDLQ